MAASQQRFSNSNSSANSKSTKERETEAAMAASSMSSAALKLLNSNQGNVKNRSRSPATATTSSITTAAAALSNKASMTMNNPSLAASLDHHSTATAGQSSLISSFLTGLPASMFTPMIDMTSTQALVTLVSSITSLELELLLPFPFLGRCN